VRLDPGVEGAPDSALPSAIAPTIYARSGDIPRRCYRGRRDDFRDSAARGESVS
jgi:hypothetical protein